MFDERYRRFMPDTVRSILLFVLAAILEIGGAWLIWQGVREHRGLVWVGVGALALAGYWFVATGQPDPSFGRILAAYGGIFVAGSLLWGVVADGFRPDRYDLVGATVCFIGVAVIMYAPRAARSLSCSSRRRARPAPCSIQSMDPRSLPTVG